MREKTHYENIVGGTEAEKKKAREELQKFFDGDGGFFKYEIEKSPEDLEIIKKTESIVDKIISQYGGDIRKLPLDNIHILKEGSVDQMTDGELAVGLHKPLCLHIGIEKQKSKLVFASFVAHELFHLKSYKSARVGNSGEDVRLYRSGFSMVDKKDTSKECGAEIEYFSKLEEAIVSECVKKFLEEIEKEDLFMDEINAINKIKNWVAGFCIKNGKTPDQVKELIIEEVKYIDDPQSIVNSVISFSRKESERQAYAAGIFSAYLEENGVEFLERRNERIMLYKLLDYLVKNSNGRFKDRDEIFDEFARANFSGNYLKIARIIESILGSGSFRKLAEDFSNVNQEEYSLDAK
ncbi:MAG TPA: hypothetical protein PLD95_03580 [bacterium]|jgi:hypothetical protein|nr:hypothetical protein [bacterium]HOG38526.1 hypothetical protein [bacterium]HQI03476.1 hypothetical protein [bacterium]